MLYKVFKNIYLVIDIISIWQLNTLFTVIRHVQTIKRRYEIFFNS